MKNFNKQILEAVNKGIQLALDDFEDDTAFAYCIPKTHWYGSQYTYTVYIQPQLKWYGMQIRPVTRK